MIDESEALRSAEARADKRRQHLMMNEVRKMFQPIESKREFNATAFMGYRMLLTVVAALLLMAQLSAKAQSAGPPVRAINLQQAKPSESANGLRAAKVTKLSAEQARQLRAKLQPSPGTPRSGNSASPGARTPNVVNPAIVGSMRSADINIEKYWVEATWNGPVTEHIIVANRGRYSTHTY